MEQELQTDLPSAQTILEEAIREERPIVAILGQSVGYAGKFRDVVLEAAIDRLGTEGDTWSDVFSYDRVDDTFLAWLNERFERRAPGNELTSVADLHFSAVFTSSFDPNLRRLFETEGRQPETILVGDPLPPISRSKLRPKIHYLFGMTGAGIFAPPKRRFDMNARRTKHAIPMLNTVLEAATPLGVIVVDGIGGSSDWLRIDEVVGAISTASSERVLWFGPDPKLSTDEHALFQELIDQRLIVRDQRTLGRVQSEISASGIVPEIRSWTEPGVVSFSNGTRLITSPLMRLSTEASASIIDDTWNDHLIPLHGSELHDSFAVFHSVPASNRLIFDGVRRGHAINRHFEKELVSVTTRALNNHSNEKGTIVVSGQSGVGKSISLYRLAERIRARKTAAVLFAKDRVPSPVELASFLAEVDRLDQVTLLIVDALEQPRRYNMLLESVRSRGHRVVIVGSSYAFDSLGPKHDGRLVEAPATLSQTERQDLLALARRHFPDVRIDDKALGSEYALAQFFWNLPYSRTRLGMGLGREARSTERELKHRGRSKRTTDLIGTLGHAFLNAGFAAAAVPVFPEEQTVDEIDAAPSRLIDYIMACSRLYRWVPINVVLRAIVSDELKSDGSLGIDLIRDLFGGHDLFRWRYDDNREEQLVVGARLQIEAKLICDARLGGPGFEVDRILDLVSNATRAGPEGHEETRFVADIVYALGPDGPLGDRYRDSYYRIAEALTHLRKRKGVRNARLMLQEATLRRHYVRRNESNIDEKRSVEILDEARESVDEALRSITTRDRGLRAGRRTAENLWVERAATYGFLASTSARRGASAERVWSSYLAAREAVHNATGRVDTYFPLDISLWLPLEILENCDQLRLEQTLELTADVAAAMDMVSEESLDSTELELFHRQRLRAGNALGSTDLGDDAFRALDEVGSTVGYYFRARQMAPERPQSRARLGESDLRKAEHAAAYLLRNRDRIADDPRCTRLLLNCFWAWKTGTWLFEGLNQPLPYAEEDRVRALEILVDLAQASGEDFHPRLRYLRAVLTWLIGSEHEALVDFRQLARDTEYVEAKRVLPRHVVADDQGNPVTFSGVVERTIGEQRWAVRVRELQRSVDLVGGRWHDNVDVGTELKAFSIAFNYIGPIASRPNLTSS